MNFNNSFSENFAHNIRLSLILLKSLRMKGNNVGFGLKFFFIPRLNTLALPTSALVQIF